MGRLAALALATLALAACGSGERAAEPAQQQPQPTTTSSAGGAQIAGVTLEGEELSFGEFRGRPLLVNVWSSW